MSKGNFGPCFKFTIGEEGRYSDSRSDPGNWQLGYVGGGRFIGTCWGISAPALIDWVGLHHADQVTAEYMRNLPLSVAKAIYQVRYWNAVRGDDLPVGVDLAVWDFGVNAGPPRSAELLQQVLGVTVDGCIGPQTIATVSEFPPETLIQPIIQHHIEYYRSLSLFSIDGRGWINRQDALRDAALRMIN